MKNDVTIQDIQNAIITIPNRPSFMLGHQLANLYSVGTKQISQAVRRNTDRFPDDFTFILERGEIATLQNEGLALNTGGHLIRAFTRLGANQLSTVLKSPVAAKRSVQIMRAFSTMEEMAEKVERVDISSIDPKRGAQLFVDTAKIFGRAGNALPRQIPASLVPSIQTLTRDARNQGANAAMKLIKKLGKSSLPHDFIEKLLRYRLRGNTQAETAKLLDVGEKTVCRYEGLAAKAGMITKNSQGKVISNA